MSFSRDSDIIFLRSRDDNDRVSSSRDLKKIMSLSQKTMFRYVVIRTKISEQAEENM